MTRLSVCMTAVLLLPSLVAADPLGTMTMQYGGTTEVMEIIPGIPGENSDWVPMGDLFKFSIVAIQPDGTRLVMDATAIPGGFEGITLQIDEPGHDRWFGDTDTGVSLAGLRFERQGDVLLVEGPISGRVETGSGQQGQITGRIDAALPMYQ